MNGDPILKNICSQVMEWIKKLKNKTNILEVFLKIHSTA
jgi:hypothetical protein